MMSFLKASICLLAITPFSQACTKLMDGKDKNENKREIIELLRKLADMLEEQENIRQPIGARNPVVVDTLDDIAGISYPIDYPIDQGAVPIPPPISPRFPKVEYLRIADKVDCPLWDDGSCGAKTAKGD